MKQIEVSARKINDAIANGLNQLGASIADVKVEILSEGGLFRKAKVRLTLIDDNEDLTALEKLEKLSREDKPKFEKPAPKPEKHEAKKEVKPEKKEVKEEVKPQAKPEPKPEKKADNKANAPKKEFKGEKKEHKPHVDTRPAAHEPVENKEYKPVSEAQVEMARKYLSELLAKMGIEAELKFDTSHGNIDIDILTDDTAVIGHHGETLDAFQILTKRAVEEGEDKFVHVNVDSRGYRMRREQTLVSLANKMAAKCVRTGRKVVLEPMSNTHRKVIHAALSDNDKVVTRSDGREPNRRVVIFPKRFEKRHNNKDNA